MGSRARQSANDAGSTRANGDSYHSRGETSDRCCCGDSNRIDRDGGAVRSDAHDTRCDINYFPHMIWKPQLDGEMTVQTMRAAMAYLI